MTPAINESERRKREILALLLAKKHGSARVARIERQTPVYDTLGCRIAPASYAQQRLWFLQQLEPDSARYNMTTAMRLDGCLDPLVLERAIDLVVQRHESLRTVFRYDGETLLQVVLPSVPFKLTRTGMHANDAGAAVAELLQRQARQPFDIANGPLLRAELLELRADAHVLVLALHHIVSDGWSLGVLTNALATVYAHLARDLPADSDVVLRPLPIQYIDYSQWQRQWLTEERLAQQAAFWRKQLEGAPRSLDLPTDFRRPLIQRGRGGKHEFSIEASVVEPLKALSQRYGATLFMTLAAALMLLLRRYSGQDDICLGTAVANRTLVELEPLIGFFVNTLVLRARVADDLDFPTWLQQVKHVAMEAYEHQDLPFEQLVQELRPDRDLSRAPLFQVIFGFDNTPRIEQDISGLRVSRLDTDARAAKFDLDVQMVAVGAGLQGAIEYDADLFHAGTIAVMAQQYAHLLGAIAAAPDTHLCKLPLQDGASMARLLALSAPTSTYPRERNLAELFEAAATAHGGAVAACDEQGEITYRELETSANRCSRYLQSFGVTPGQRVGICIERDRRLLIAMLAALKAGAAYVPLDSNYPAARLHFMLEQADVRVVLADATHAAMVPAGAWRGLDFERVLEESATLDGEALHLPVPADSLSHVMYTSGSTGRPKGVMVPHRAVVRLAMNSNYLSVPRDVRVAQVAGISFDAATFEIWSALLNGARLEFIPRHIVLDPAALAATLRERGIDIMLLTTALFSQVAQHEPTAFASLRVLLFGGERAPVDAVTRVLAHRPQRLINAYGPTENGVMATWHEVEALDGNAASVPIGRAVSNSCVLVLDAERQPCPLCVPGEIYVGGDGLAAGYMGRADLTAERFVEVDIEGTTRRLYRTGDRGRWLPGGALEFIGRGDDQLKIRGVRIEPGEIEAHLKGHPVVRDAVVMARDDGGGLHLVAYIVAKEAEQGAGQSEVDTQLQDWNALYDDTYARLAAQEDPRLNFTGWHSTYTGMALPVEQMREWAERAAARILALRPMRVFEIGCGSGLMLFRVAPQVERYRALDHSRAALEYVSSKLHLLGDRSAAVSLHRAAAHEIGSCEERDFDTIVLNSIVQYFPQAEYLVGVIRDAMQLLALGGRIFIGDLRNYRLQEMFATSIEFERSAADTPLRELRRRIAQRIRHDGELLVAPEFFYVLRQHLPDIARIEIMPRVAADDNELTKYRYDVVLHKHGAPGAMWNPAPARWHEWSADCRGLDGLEAILSQAQDCVAVCCVPNAKLTADRAVMRALGQMAQGTDDCAALRRHVARELQSAPEHSEFEALALRYGYLMSTSYGRSGFDGSFDLILRKASPAGGEASPPEFPEPSSASAPLDSFTSSPLGSRRHAQLLSELRATLAAQLPDPMMPSAYVLLDAIPLTVNGKIDHAALPQPPDDVQRACAFAPPRSEWEQNVAAVWRQLLGVEDVGLDDNFFTLGGHSLLAAQVMSRLQKQLGLAPQLASARFGIRTLFEAPTLAQLAAAAERIATERQIFAAPQGDEVEVMEEFRL